MKTAKNIIAGNCRGASGIALVVVLGVLAAIVILAVSFAITMRTERVAAANAMDNIRARQLLDVALSRAMMFLQNNLTNQVYPEWGVTNSGLRVDPGTGEFDTNWYTDKGLFLSDFTDQVRTYWVIAPPNAPSNEPGFLYGDITNYVPFAFWNEAWNASATRTYWEPVVTPVSAPDQTNRVIGRVAYLAINCSGLLDANFVNADSQPRAYGTNAGEIQVSRLSDIFPNVVEFVNDRADNNRYETYHELTAKNSDKAGDNFFVHSLALPGYCANFTNPPSDRNVSTSVFIGGTSAEMEVEPQRSAIIAALRVAFTNLNAGEAGMLFTNLLDYADNPAAIPRNNPRLSPSVKAVPMINELVISNRWTRASETNYISTVVRTELWYPFPAAGAGFTHTFRLQAFFVAGAVRGTNIISWVQSPPAEPYSFITSVGIYTSVFVSASAPTRVDWAFTSRVSNAGGDVDYLQGTNSVATPAPGTWVISGFECLDPRFNWNFYTNAQWRSTANFSLGQLNPWVTNYWAANPGCDTSTVMYCAGRPLQSQAELSCLAYEPWRTLSMTNSLMLDAFAVDTNAVGTNTCWRGPVNPNSDMPEALAAVFYEMPVGQYGGDLDGTDPIHRLSWDDALCLATNIIMNGPYTNLSDLGRQAIWDGFFGAMSQASRMTNSLIRECFIRDSVRLLNVRQNVFTVLLVAELAGVDGGFPMHGVRQKAVAIVWRDPYLNRFRLHSMKLIRD